MNEDEKRFRKILLFIDNNCKSLILTTGNVLKYNFGENVFQSTHRLDDKGVFQYVQRKKRPFLNN